MKQETPMQLRYQGLHNQFAASALAVKAGHEIAPQCRIGCMIVQLTTYPLTCNPDDMLKTQQRNQILDLFCGDVQVWGEYSHFMKRFFKENQIELQMEPGDLEILKNGCVDFYMFSYYMTSCERTKTDQERTEGNIGGGIKYPYLETSDWG